MPPLRIHTQENVEATIPFNFVNLACHFLPAKSCVGSGQQLFQCVEYGLWAIKSVTQKKSYWVTRERKQSETKSNKQGKRILAS